MTVLEMHQSYTQFTQTDQWFRRSYEHVLHSVNARLLCMSAAGFKQCGLCLLLAAAFSFHFKGGSCGLFLNVKGKQMLDLSSFARSRSPQSYRCHLCDDLSCLFY